MSRAALICLLLLVGGCYDELDPGDQGPCAHLPVATCQADARCQQGYETNPQSNATLGPQPMFCLQLTGSGATTAACAGLDHDGCRARADCSPVYWQDLGPVDGPVGDPYFKFCQAEAQ